MIVVGTSERRIFVRSPRRYRRILRNIPGSWWNPELSCWEFPRTPATAENLHADLPPNGVWDEAAQQLLTQRREQTRLLTTLRDYENTELAPLPFAPVTKPWRHQLAAYHAAMAAEGFLLFLGMGAGKSWVTLALIEGRQAELTLVVCPKSVVETWQAEVERHAPHLGVVALGQGPVRRRLEKARRAVENRRGPLLVVINVDSVWRKPFGDWALEQPWDAVVADEVQRLKAPGGRASRYMAKLGERVPYRLGLSGTPCPHGPLDAYGIYRFLDPGIFGTSFARFRARYAVLGGYQNRQILGYQNQEELNRRFYSIAFRVDRDVLDLPPEQHIERTCTLPSEARRIYNELREDFVAFVEKGLVTAANALTQLLKLQQLAAGHLSDGETTFEIHRAKQELLEELLSELSEDEPVVVFARFTADLLQVHNACERVGRQCLELSGHRNQLKAWQSGRGTVLATQIQAGGVGVSMVRARYAVYFSQTWSLGDYEQSVARLHRPGQARAVTYVHLIARSTVDRHLYRSLRHKKDAIEEILRNPQTLER